MNTQHSRDADGMLQRPTSRMHTVCDKQRQCVPTSRMLCFSQMVASPVNSALLYESDKASHASGLLPNFRSYAFVYDSCRRAVGPESSALASTTVRGAWTTSLHELLESCFAGANSRRRRLLRCSTSPTKNLHWLQSLYCCISSALERRNPVDACASHPVAYSREMVYWSVDHRCMCARANWKGRNWDLTSWW